MKKNLQKREVIYCNYLNLFVFYLIGFARIRSTQTRKRTNENIRS
ncbi:hypothetical protein HMPREF9687_05432 [Klebsiella oxytoca 10-5243]|nr:hypothetical protein HMPREF9687_05432 [Klebsiella oxytoca 10-5243]VVL69933.1 Uncharacterised protein [Klebsiella variicola]